MPSPVLGTTASNEHRDMEENRLRDKRIQKLCDTFLESERERAETDRERAECYKRSSTIEHENSSGERLIRRWID